MCAVPMFPLPGSVQDAVPFSLHWHKHPSELLGLPFGYLVSLGTDYPPSNIVREVDVNQTDTFFTGYKNNGTYYWQVIPYGLNRTLAVDCSIWSFNVLVKVVSEFPYLEDFESGKGNWVSYGHNNSWSFGTPLKSTIKLAHSGTKAWITGDINQSYASDENSFVLSPLFNFSAFTRDPFLEMYIWWECEDSWDGASVQYSSNNGTSWTTVGRVRDKKNWYTSDNIAADPGGQSHGWTGNDGSGSEGWTHVAHPITGTASLPHVYIRVCFASDPSIEDDGFAFDDVRITGTTDPLTGNETTGESSEFASEPTDMTTSTSSTHGTRPPKPATSSTTTRWRGSSTSSAAISGNFQGTTEDLDQPVTSASDLTGAGPVTTVKSGSMDPGMIFPIVVVGALLILAVAALAWYIVTKWISRNPVL